MFSKAEGEETEWRKMVVFYDALHLNHFICDISEINFQQLSEKNTYASHREASTELRTWHVLVFGLLQSTGRRP
jgi:hypothetical protein